MAWHPNNGLKRLIEQWKDGNPGKEVVYTIADNKHDPKSDHQVDKDGTVDAADFMPGPTVTDAELDEFAETLRVNRDNRVKYVIRRQRIFAGVDGPKPWEWRDHIGKYHGHTHVSTREVNEDNGRAWDLTRTPPVLREGSTGYYVRALQRALRITVDGKFGPKTEAAVKAFQRAHKLTADGIVGPKTWAKLPPL